jgi:D-glycero-D-manno-heptose 1,7-bisphosphate phosphatase
MQIETIFFDRDGIINDVISRDNIIASPRSMAEFHIKDEFIALHKNLPRELNLFVVTNQPDVSRSLLPIDTLKAMHNNLMTEFAFKEILYCPHDNADNCECRKPKPGMIQSLLTKYGLKKESALIVGDSEKDILAGQAAGTQTIYWQQYYNPLRHCKPHFVIDKLSDMLDIIRHSQVDNHGI